MGQQTYSSGSGNWTVPSGVTSVTLLAVGGGGGGEAAGGGNGGGGGGTISRTSYSVTPGASISYSVGAGGVGGNGGNTTFDGLIAYGGVAGNGTPGTGGGGDFTGGTGAAPVMGVPGGGGSSAGRAANGNNASGITGGTAVTDGGAGGDGGDPPFDGSFPGGGGGGSGGMTMGGSGGGGYIQIDWSATVPICGFTTGHSQRTRSSQMWHLKQSTASQIIPLGPFIDNTDGKTRKTALTIANTDIRLEKLGATTFANKNSGGATHVENGNYYTTLDATDTNTLGPMRIHVDMTSGGALAVWLDCMVWSSAMYDFLFGTVAPSTQSASDNATGLLDLANGVESGLTLRQTMKIVAASLGGKCSGGGTGTIVFRNVADTKDVISATVDNYGNRSALTRDVT